MGESLSKTDRHHEPRVIWKWERFPSSFVAYPSRISNAIERHFLSGSREILEVTGSNYLLYYIDVMEMVQITAKSKKKRRICREVVRESFSTTRWSWESKYLDMQPYTLPISEKIEACYQKGDNSSIEIEIGGVWYRIIPSKKVQINLKTKKSRKIERNTLQDHKFKWQWQHSDGMFINYSEEQSFKLELHYLTRKSHTFIMSINENSYIIDTEKMCQTNITSKKSRQIKRVQENYLQYIWLWKNKEKWNPFEPELVEKLEVNFLSKKQSPLLLEIEGKQYELDTILMTKKRTEDYEVWKIKREPLSNDRPVWVWESHNGILKSFPVEVSKILEARNLLGDAGPDVLENIEITGKKYKIDMKNMEKINIETGGKRKIERELVPCFYPSALERLPQTERCKIFKFFAESQYVPAEWNWQQTQETETFLASDIERNLLLEKFFNTMEEAKYEVTGVFRIQNINQMNNFLLEQMNIKEFSHGFNEPTLLFYLPGEGNFEELYKKPEYAVKGKFSSRTDFGKGFYFSRSADLCNDYTYKTDDQSKIMVCFWVLLGRSIAIIEDNDFTAAYNGKYNTKSEIKRPPHGSDSISTIIKETEMHIVYRPELCCPLYYLSYREKLD